MKETQNLTPLYDRYDGQWQIEVFPQVGVDIKTRSVKNDTHILTNKNIECKKFI